MHRSLVNMVGDFFIRALVLLVLLVFCREGKVNSDFPMLLE